MINDFEAATTAEAKVDEFSGGVIWECAYDLCNVLKYYDWFRHQIQKPFNIAFMRNKVRQKLSKNV